MDNPHCYLKFSREERERIQKFREMRDCVRQHPSQYSLVALKERVNGMIKWVLLYSHGNLKEVMKTL